MPEFELIGTAHRGARRGRLRPECEGGGRKFAALSHSQKELDRFISRQVCRSSAGPTGLATAVASAEAELEDAPRRLYHLSVPPAAAADVIRTLGEAGLTERASDHGEAVRYRPRQRAGAGPAMHEVFEEQQIFGSITSSARRRRRTSCFGSRTACSSRSGTAATSITSRSTSPRRSRSAVAPASTKGRGRSVTWSSRTCSRCSRSSPWSRRPRSRRWRSPRRSRSSARSGPLDPGRVVRGQYGNRSEDGVDRNSQTETFIALECQIDNWRWSASPSICVPASRMAEGARIISIAFREPPQSMFPAGSGIDKYGPDMHLTFDLDESARLSLSFCKRPGPSMMLDKLSMRILARRDRPRERHSGGLRAPDPRRDER